jgi:GTP-binding protein YchF
VRGASRGEGLGNRFLGHIREMDATALVVRSFDDGDVTHIEGDVDPVRDLDVVELELQLADLETVRRRLERAEKTSRLQKEHATALIELLRRVEAHLDQGCSVRTLSLGVEERSSLRDLWLLTAKPLMVVVNVAEADASQPLPAAVVERALGAGGEAIAVSARIESELADLEPGEQRAFLDDLGLAESGLDRVARTAYRLLELITFFTAGEKEVRAWTLRRDGTALDAAATIHTDFAKGFIRAEVTSVDQLLEAGSYAALRERGWQRLEGRDYVVQDGDVVHFRFNV